MSEQLDPVRALRIIEGLTIEPSLDGGLYATIYKIAHQAGKPSCAKNHTSWSDEAIQIETELVKERIIPSWRGE